MAIADPRPVGHHRIECSCGRIISTCRCIGPHVPVIRQHPACGIEPPLNPPSGDSPINAGMLPGRKRPVLYEVRPGPDGRGGSIVPLAYFVDREAMERFLAFNPRVARTPKEPDAPPRPVN